MDAMITFQQGQMASCNINSADIHGWLQSLPSITQWKSSSISLCICSSGSSKPSIYLSMSKPKAGPSIYLSLSAYFNLTVSLWTSKPFTTNSQSISLMDDQTLSTLLTNIIEEVLNYSSNKCRSSLRVPRMDSISKFKEVFNMTILTLSFLVCIYEVPTNLRSECLMTLKNQLTDCRSKEALKLLMKALGSNLEEQWMRSINLAITNWIVELQVTKCGTIRTPSPLFSYSFSTLGLWKIQLYCPVIAMEVESTSNATADERLQFSLRHHQLEGVIQLNYRVITREKWVDVILHIDNIRCDIVRLVNEALMTEQGVGTGEKHFPSRISLHLTPVVQTNIISVSVSKSSENPAREYEIGKSMEASFDPPNSFLGLKLGAAETMSMSLKSWIFEESVYGYSGIMSWLLHDTGDGREVFSSKPSKLALMNPKAWFKDRYSSAYRPFTRQGGVIFARDEYGKSICWKVDKSALGKPMEWEIKGWIWLTYWPNKHRTLYTETRRLEFREVVHLTIA